MAGTRTLILMTKEALSEHEQAMEGLPGSEIDGQSQAVKVSTIGQLLLKGLAKSTVMGLSAFLRTLLHLEKKGELSFCQTGCPEGADAGLCFRFSIFGFVLRSFMESVKPAQLKV